MTDFRGPPPPPWFQDNGCGPYRAKPKGRGALAWLAWAFVYALAWAVPDLPRLACRWHDHAYHVIELVRGWRAGGLAATDELKNYARWLREQGIVQPDETWAAVLLRLDITRADADRWLRENYRVERSGVLAWFGSWLYWLGVRLGGIGSA